MFTIIWKLSAVSINIFVGLELTLVVAQGAGSINELVGMPKDTTYQVHHSSSPNEAHKDTENMFGKNQATFPRTAVFKQSTLCLIKPHTVSHGNVTSFSSID